MALEVNPTACALDPVISLYRIGSRSFIDEGGEKHFLSLCGQLPPELSLLPVSWYHLPWCLETLPLTSVPTAVLFSILFLKVEVLFTCP